VGQIYGEENYLDRPVGVFVDGNYAYVVDAHEDALVVIDVSNKSNPTRVGQITGAENYLDGAWGVVVDGDYAYVTSQLSDALVIIDISTKTDPVRVGQITGAENYLDVAGNVFVDGNYAYITSRASDALVIIDISNKSAPTRVGQIYGSENYLEYPYEVFVQDDYAYVLSLDPGALVVIDISNKSAPTYEGHIQDQENYLDNPRGVVVDGNYAYVASNESDALVIIDISNKSTPIQIGQISGESKHIVDIEDVFVDGDYAYVVGGYAEVASFTIIDISNKSAPTYVGHTQSGGGNYLVSPKSVAVDGNYAYVVDNSGDALVIIDISNRSTPTWVGYITGSENYLDGARGVVVQGDYAYVASYTSDALVIIDVSNKAAPARVGQITGSENYLEGAWGVFVQGNYAYVISIEEHALVVIDISNKSAPTRVGQITGAWNYLEVPRSVVIQGNHAYIASEDSDALVIIDISNKSAPTRVGQITGAENYLDGPRSVFVDGNYVYVASAASDALAIFEVPKSPSPPTGIDTTSEEEYNIISFIADPEADKTHIYWDTSPIVTPLTGTKISDVSSPYEHVDINPSLIYYYILTSENEFDEEGDPSSKHNSSPIPKTPEHIDTTANIERVTISWTDSTGADSYNIYWKLTSPVTKATGTKITEAVSPYSHTGLIPSQAYYYVITAEDEDGESDISYEVSEEPLLNTPVIDGTADYNSVYITWDNVQYADTYNMYWDTTPGVTKDTGAKITDVTSPYKHTNRTPKRPYYYIVTVENEIEESNKSNEINIRPLFASPIDNITATPGTEEGQIILAWNNSTTYNIYWSYTSGVTIENGTKIENVNSPYTHTTPTLIDTYYYIITCVNEWGESEISEEVSAVPGDIIFINDLYIPELDYYFKNYWTDRGEITIDNINIPEVEETEGTLPTGSFLELLFSQTFDSTAYTYRFEEVEITIFSKHIRERLSTRYTSSDYFISSDSTSDINLFRLRHDDLVLLDKLLAYRRTGNTSLIGITYNNLSTNLSKLIYIYIDLVLNSSYTRLNSDIVISSESSALENLFELYVVNESHKTMKIWTNLIDSNLLELRLVHEVKTITSAIETSKEVSLGEIVYDYNIDVYHNGEKLTFNTDYIIAIDTTAEDSTAVVTWVVWEDKDINIVEDDVLVIEYYTKVNQNDTSTNAFVDGEEFEEGG